MGYYCICLEELEQFEMNYGFNLYEFCVHMDFLCKFSVFL